MKRSQIPFNSLRAFEITAKQLSFKNAADILCVTQSAISRHVSNLEKLLGLKLFERHHQGITLTDAGKKILPAISSSFDIIEESLKDVTNNGNQKKVALNVPPTFGNRFITPILGHFIQQNPTINVEISADGFYGFGSLDSGSDLAIIFSDTPPNTGYCIDKLRDEKVVPMCSPDYMKKENISADSYDWVSRVEFISTAVPRGPYGLWETWKKTKNVTEGKVSQSTIFATAQMSATYAIDFGGVTIADPVLFKDEINAGTLVPIGEPIDSGYSYFMAYAMSLNDNTSITKLRTFIQNNIELE